MSTTELAALIGQECLVSVGALRFRCTIKDATRQYGNDRVLVAPADGIGEDWKNLDSVKLLKPSEASK